MKFKGNSKNYLPGPENRQETPHKSDFTYKTSKFGEKLVKFGWSVNYTNFGHSGHFYKKIFVGTNSSLKCGVTLKISNGFLQATQSY